MKPYLTETEKGLALTDGNVSMMGDFSKEIPRIKKGVIGTELIVKAAKIKGKDHPTAVDATAGMGSDALLLAAAGFNVTMYEKDETIAALLEDALKRASEDEYLSGITARMVLKKEDSINALLNMKESPDVILLDPMFPEREKSALIKKKFQLLQQLERPCSDEKELLDAAVSAKPKKIIIKRPLKGPFLAGVKPSYSVNGKAIRVDVIVDP